MKRPMLIVCSLLLAGATALAAATAPYRITLRDGRQILAKDRPVRSGSVLLYHPYPRGVVTSVPIEFIFGVNAALATSVNEAPTISVLNPGDLIILGPTGEGQPAPEPVALAPPAPGSATIPGGVYDPRMPIYGGGTYLAPNAPGNPNAPSNLMGLTPNGDLARAQSGPPPTAESPIAPNGFPATSGSQPLTIGPNGTPVMAPSGAPGSQQPTIGPNGTPVLAPPGAPGSTPPAVGPNGYPVPRGSGQ
jgi:hypothetical protein